MTSFRRGVKAVPVLAMLITGLAFVGSAAAEPAPSLTCGSVIMENTRLAADVGPCPGDGLIIGADHVRLDLAGHRVIGTFVKLPGFPFSTAGGEFAGIRFRQVVGSTVENGEVFHFAVGATILGGSANRVKGLNVHDNFGPGINATNGDGITAWNSNDNTIERNVIVQNAPFSGIALVEKSNFNRVLDNQVSNNNLTGQDFGIRVEGPSATHNDIERNFVINSGASGIEIEPSCHDVSFKPNSPPPTCAGDVSNSDNIIRNNESDHNGFIGGRAGSMGGQGINLFPGGNSAVKEPTGEIIEGNITKDNHADGIHIGGGPCNNFFRVNPADPRSCAATNNIVDHNTSVGNGHDGINLGRGADYNTVSHNTADSNGRDGIVADIGVRDTTQPPAPPVFVTIPGAGAESNTFVNNEASRNKLWDGSDANPNCDHNIWAHNDFTTVNQSCVLGLSRGH